MARPAGLSPAIHFSAAPAVVEAVRRWQRWLADERRSSPHTIDAYSRDLAAYVFHSAIERLDHRHELVDEGPLHVDEQTPLVSEQGPCHGTHPLTSILGEQTPTLQMKPDVVDLGLDAVHHARTFAYESRPVA